MSEWQSTEHPRIQILCIEVVGYKARWETDVPRTRVRCPKCRKDIVPKKDGTLYGHGCDSPAYDRGYKYCRKAGSVRIFGTRTQAIAVALHEAGIVSAPEQIESRVLSGIHTTEGHSNAAI